MGCLPSMPLAGYYPPPPFCAAPADCRNDPVFIGGSAGSVRWKRKRGRLVGSYSSDSLRTMKEFEKLRREDPDITTSRGAKQIVSDELRRRLENRERWFVQADKDKLATWADDRVDSMRKCLESQEKRNKKALRNRQRWYEAFTAAYEAAFGVAPPPTAIESGRCDH